MKANESVAKRLKKNNAKSYRAYVAEKGLGEDESESIKQNAKKELAFSDTRYGALGEALSRSGLFSGGYEEYLKSAGSDNYADEAKRAEEAKMLAEGRRVGGYERYLSEYDKMQSKMSEAFINDMKNGSVYDIDEMYSLAAERGLSESNALYTAAAAVRQSSLNATDKVVNFAARYGLTPKQVANYAKSLGLQQHYVEKIKDAVSQFTENNPKGATYSEYMEYIINKYSKK